MEDVLFVDKTNSELLEEIDRLQQRINLLEQHIGFVKESE